MERLFLDTNLLLDFVLDRKPFSDHTEEILALKYTQKKKLFTSALSIANVAYVVRKAGKNPFTTVEDLFDWVEIVNLTKAELKSSVKSTFKDFEDAIQYYSAQSIQADVIITRDIKDFATSAILVQSPIQFLRFVNK